ncbi:BcpO-related WXXGXW repeat protein [Ramlibacter terrae]|uniref:BcpO-related WXXGXW repeat protein n=1 Tax=Ramlibacter terrae TaxID=2732511 RepID=A0ABX6P485_9BURK|nr:BcpO-related WXXGXW repeat protein [Ramlibacter terrae]
MNNKTILGGIIAASLLGFGAAANAQYTAIVSVAPPAPQYEVVPAPRRGYVWAPGHYEWRGNQHVWVQGHWLTARNGYDYREPRWVQRGNGQWVLVGNTWERRGPNGDRDGDGIANRYDRDRNGDGYADNRRGGRGPNGDIDRDGVSNRNDRDRDGDGVPNHRDQFPDNRNRS